MPKALNRRKKQSHTMEGPPEEYINEYDVDDNEEAQVGWHSRIIIEPVVHSTKTTAKVVFKIFSFLHR